MGPGCYIIAVLLSNRNVVNISVLIATSDRPRELDRCLQSIANLEPAPFECIVLDNNSETTPDLSSVSGLRVNVISSASSLGVSESKNNLLRAASGDLCVHLDDDAWFSHPDAMSRIQDHMADDSVAALAFRIVDHVEDGEKLLVPFAQKYRRSNPALGEKNSLASYFLGGGVCLRTKALEKCGFFDPEFEYGHEELDLSYRLINAGYKIAYAADVVVEHERPKNLSAELHRRQFFHHPRNRILIARKHLPMPYRFVYLLSWFSRYFVDSLRGGGIRSLFDAIRSGVETSKNGSRSKLSPEAVEYLKANYGRLWN